MSALPAFATSTTPPAPAAVLTPAVVAEIHAPPMRVLSAEGPYACSLELRERICLLENGELHVVNGSRMHPMVLDYIHDLERKGVPHRVVNSSLEGVRELYARSHTGDAADGSQEMSGRQQQVIADIKRAVKAGASDLHLVVDDRIGYVMIRVHGELRVVRDMPASECLALCATIYQSMCSVADTTWQPERKQDGAMKEAFVMDAGLYGVRVATLPLSPGYSMFLRLLYNNSAKPRTLADLGYLPEQIEMLTAMTKRTRGVYIFSGSTGSGKSSTLEAALRMIYNHFRGSKNIITVEDPPEYRVRGVKQHPKGPDPWAKAIKALMRSDPDVLMVGEMRDYDSALAALQGASTGHALWTTVHTQDAAAVLQRLANFEGPEGAKLDPSLYTDPTLVRGLINQALIPTLCPNCKVRWTDLPASEVSELIAARVKKWCAVDSVYARGPGCDRCRDTPGIAGRIPAAEIIIPDMQFMRVFRERGNAEARADWIKRLQGITKIHAMIRHIDAGLIDPRMGEEIVGELDEDEIATQ